MVGPENISYLLNPDCVVLNKGSRGSKENYTSIRWVINHVITDYPIGTGKAAKALIDYITGYITKSSLLSGQ